MSTRRNQIDEASRRARSRLAEALTEGRLARIGHGLSQAQIAGALRCSRQLVGVLEAGGLRDVGVIRLARYAAAVGLDVSMRTFPTGPAVRDIGQLRLLERLRAVIDEVWAWRTEVPVGVDARDLRALDAVLSNGQLRVGIEAVTRLSDVQAQVRQITLKQQAFRLRTLVLVLADTRTNRRAVNSGAATLRPAFPLGARVVLAALRAGREPQQNGLLLL